ncbi:unnamed protein product [Haemonchus placei]|uniref:RT_RNaseH_2 domain-containing protein n=1 Tax=Haemonchus placei TaxID=6290 RepID=A0A0N4W5A1_HAEPC|nr:unnamed protein product [Haemonchus placei]
MNMRKLLKHRRKLLWRHLSMVQPKTEKARDGSRPLIICTDASSVGIGAQHKRGMTRCYIPYSLLPSIYRPQKGIITSRIRKRSRSFSARRSFTTSYMASRVLSELTTQHSPHSLFKRTDVSPEFYCYDLTIDYIKGTANAVADALSRGPTHSSILIPGL